MNERTQCKIVNELDFADHFSDAELHQAIDGYCRTHFGIPPEDFKARVRAGEIFATNDGRELAELVKALDARPDGVR